MILISSFKERLTNELNAQNISQYHLAKITGIPQTTMSAYMSGRFDPKREYLTAIADALKVEELYLLGYDVPKEKTSSIKEEIDELISKMNLNQLNQAKKILEMIVKEG